MLIVSGDIVAILFSILAIASIFFTVNMFDNVILDNNFMIVLVEMAFITVGCDNLVNMEDKMEGPIMSTKYGNEVTTSISCNSVSGDWLFIVEISKGANRVCVISGVITEIRFGAKRDMRYHRRTIRLIHMSMVRAEEDAMVLSIAART